MPNDRVRNELVELAEMIKTVRELSAGGAVEQAEVAERHFLARFNRFFQENRSYFFENAREANALSSGQGALADRYSIYNNPMGRGIMSCSCGPVEDSCDECGPGMFSYFTLTDDATILRVRMPK